MIEGRAVIVQARGRRPASVWAVTISILIGLFVIITGYSSAKAQTCIPPPSGIVAWWPFDETGGSTAQDIVGSHPGIYVGEPEHGLGKVDGAIRLNGAEYIQVEDSDFWAFGSTDFTVELWANLSADGDAVFVGNDECGGPCNKWFFGYYWGFGNCGLNFTLNGPLLGDRFLACTNTWQTKTEWHHYAASRSGSTYTLYIDGNSVSSEENNEAIPDPAAPLTIGQAEGLGWINGFIDEMSIYRRALTADEIRAIFEAGSAGKCKTTTSVTPSQAANTGSVTLTVAGEGFTPATTVTLSGTALPSLNTTAVTFVSTTTLWAVFNLEGVQTGIYDLTITTPSAPPVVYEDAFEIIEGTLGQLDASLHGPPAVRNSRKYSWGLQYSNRGGANIDAPLLVISSNDGSEMSLSPTKPFTKKPLQVLAINQNLPPGTLPPGNSSGLSFFQRITGGDTTIDIVKLVENATPIPWDAMKADLRPSDMDPLAWEIVFGNFRGQMGETWEEYARTLRADATYLSLYRRSLRGTLAEGKISLGQDSDSTVYDVSTLLAFEFARAAGALAPRSVLAAGQDIAQPVLGAGQFEGHG